MKFVVLVFVLLLFVLAIWGCAPYRESKADYVRSHKCAVEETFPDTTTYTKEEGRHTDFGWTAYKCPDGTYVNIENNEAQP